MLSLELLPFVKKEIYMYIQIPATELGTKS